MHRIAHAIIKVYPDKIAAELDNDFARYYRQLIYWEFPNLIGGLSLPRHNTHITIARSKFCEIDFHKAEKWRDAIVEFSYDPTKIYIGGFSKNFVGFYLKVYSSALDKIKKEIMLREWQESSFHLSLCNTKNASI